MEEVKVGYVTISTKEYRELILKEKELEEEREFGSDLIQDKKILKSEIEKLEEELKDLLLAIVKNTEAQYNNEFYNYDMKNINEIANYIEQNYSKDGVLQFRKIEKEQGTDE